MTNRKLMQQLHDELVDSLKGGIIPFETGQMIKKRREKLIEELRALLAQQGEWQVNEYGDSKWVAQPEPEPVAWWCSTCNRECNPIEVTYEERHEECGTFIGNTAPLRKEWQGLTDEERKEVFKPFGNAMDFARAIEAKLKEKNSA